MLLSLGLHLRKLSCWLHIHVKCELPLQTLAELHESLKHLETLQGDLAKPQAQLPFIHEFPVRNKFKVLKVQEKPICIMSGYLEYRL